MQHKWQSLGLHINKKLIAMIRLDLKLCRHRNYEDWPESDSPRIIGFSVYRHMIMKVYTAAKLSPGSLVVTGMY